jgi:AraC-like DNA-binding protein
LGGRRVPPDLSTQVLSRSLSARSANGDLGPPFGPVALEHAVARLAARILRFQHAVELASAADGLGWAEIAHGSGYYDQAHMVRDFQQFTGHSPTGYQRLTLPDGGGVVGD